MTLLTALAIGAAFLLGVRLGLALGHRNAARAQARRARDAEKKAG